MNQRTRYTYGKKEKLKSRKEIALLFKEGRSVTVYPLKCIWLLKPISTHELTIRCGVTVQKKTFGKAVERNKIKRHLREAWRVQKHQLEQQENLVTGTLSLFYLYIGRDAGEIKMIPAAMQKLIKKLEGNLCKN